MDVAYLTNILVNNAVMNTFAIKIKVFTYPYATFPLE